MNIWGKDDREGKERNEKNIDIKEIDWLGGIKLF